MDAQKKQKVMIGVLATAVLGAGASFFLFGDSDSSDAEAANTGPVARRVREPSQTEGKSARRTRTTKTRANKPKATVQRRQREEVESKTAERRTKRGQNRKKIKKNVPTPAA